MTVVEKTGAGDGYTSAFLAAWCHHLSVETAMQWGSYNAAAVIGKVGAQAGLLTNEAMKHKIQEELL